jgi:hypothetical protein
MMVWNEDTVVDNGAIWATTDWQLENGSVCTQFERTPLAHDIELCSRYYEKSYNMVDVPGTNTVSGLVGGSMSNSGATNVQAVVPFKTQKRGSPVVALYGKTGAANQFYSQATGVDAVGIGVSYIADTGMVVTSSTTASESVLFHYTAAAEL